MPEPQDEPLTLEELLVRDERGFLPDRLELVERADGSLLMRGDVSVRAKDHWGRRAGIAMCGGLALLILMIWLAQRSTATSFSWPRFALVCSGGLGVLGLFAVFHSWVWRMHANSVRLIGNGIGDVLLWEPANGGSISVRAGRFPRCDVVSIRWLTGWISDSEDRTRIGQLQIAVCGRDPQAGFDVYPVVSVSNAPRLLRGRDLEEIVDTIADAAGIPVRRYTFKIRNSAEMEIVRRIVPEVRTWPMNPVRLAADSQSEVRR